MRRDLDNVPLCQVSTLEGNGLLLSVFNATHWRSNRFDMFWFDLEHQRRICWSMFWLDFSRCQSLLDPCWQRTRATAPNQAICRPADHQKSWTAQRQEWRLGLAKMERTKYIEKICFLTTQKFQWVKIKAARLGMLGASGRPNNDSCPHLLVWRRDWADHVLNDCII